MLSVHNLSFAFGSRVLFKEVSFELAPGSLLRIKGPNGAGKSTLISLVAGLLSGATGEINFKDSSDVDPRSWCAWIPPDANALNGNLSAVDNLKFWLGLRDSTKSEATIQNALDAWGLKGDYTIRHMPVMHFSTGMKRRLSLARLELLDAKLWLLDEPLFGLDDKACVQFSTRLGAHLGGGGSALVVTHDERLLSGITFSTLSLGETS